VTFEQVDLREEYEGEFDIVVALMVLMDIPELSKLKLTIRAGGVLIATILHPAFFLQKTVDDEDGGYREVRGYLDEESWWIDSFGGHWHYHRPLSWYVSWIASRGLGLVELFEPEPVVYGGWRRKIPTRMGLAARRCEGASERSSPATQRGEVTDTGAGLVRGFEVERSCTVASWNKAHA
jgi:hypothetical protein